VTAVAVLSLTLGIGANTAIFTVFDALLLRSLAVKNPRQIVMLTWLATNSASRPQHDGDFSFPMFEQFRHSSALSDVIGFTWIQGLRVIAGGPADYADGEAVSGNYHAVLGVAPVVGRALVDDDDRESAAPVCVISYRFWESRFGRDPAAIGQKIVLAEVPVTLVGVEPKGFFGMMPGYAADFKIPIHLLPQISANSLANARFLDTNDWWVTLAARVPRAREARASAEINLLFHQSLPQNQQNRAVMFGPGGEGSKSFRSQFRNPLLVLMAAVGLILLIACANVANLLLARAKAREKEIATRLALGAGRQRLVRQLLTESVLLAAMGAAFGTGLAYWASGVLASFNGLAIDVRPEARVLGFTAAITLLTGILFGLAPAIWAARAELQPSLQRDTPFSRFGLASALIVAQLALSLVAVVGAALYLRTLHNLRDVDLGMNIHNLTVFRLAPGGSGYSTDERAAKFAQRVLDRLEKIPAGVESVALSGAMPLQGSWSSTTIDVPGSSPPADLSLRHVGMNPVTAQFFKTMGIPVLLGRGIEERDRLGTTPVAVVNETLATAFFPHESPIGRHFLVKTQDYEIVGVARDGKYNGTRRAAPPTFFVSYPQSSVSFKRFAVALRTRKNPAAVTGYVRRAVAEIDPNVPLRGLETADETIDRLIRQDRLFAALSSIFGALALLLSAIGVYGVRTYAVARRTPEIGIRMALGADRGTITQMILRETGWVALAGVAIGLGVASAVTRYIQSMLYGLAPHDFTTFAGAAVVLVAIAAFAGYLPAHRAARVDPMVALRHD
jgi:predicted permease